MKITWKELLELPTNAVFFEDDLPTTPMFAKVCGCNGKYKGLDIRVIPIYGNDDGTSRLGLYEMDECTRNSKRWHWLNEEEINTAIGRLMLASHATKHNL
jgi:hypothetical protein